MKNKPFATTIAPKHNYIKSVRKSALPHTDTLAHKDERDSSNSSGVAQSCLLESKHTLESNGHDCASSQSTQFSRLNSTHSRALDSTHSIGVDSTHLDSIPLESVPQSTFQSTSQHTTEKQAQELESKKEHRVLLVSMYSAFVLAVFGVGFGVWIQSKAVIFDGFVALISVGLGALSVITSRYIYREDDDIFQYGYVRFEPMVNFFKSLILVLVCAYAFINALESIFAGGYEVLLDGAVVYTLCALVFCAILFSYTRVYARSLDSSLILVDNTEWKIDCVLYFGALCAFVILFILLFPLEQIKLDSSDIESSLSLISFIAFVRENVPLNTEQIATLARYVDPSLLAILSLLLCISPIRICVENFKDLLMVAPKEIDEKLTFIMEQLSQKYGFSDYDTHTAKSGRFYMIEINILIPNISRNAYANAHSATLTPDLHAYTSYAHTPQTHTPTIYDLDIIRDEIQNALEIPSYKIWLSVSYTANPQWL